MKNSNATICSSEPESGAALSEKPRMMAAPRDSSSTAVTGGVLFPKRARRRRTHLRSDEHQESTEKDELFEKKIVALKKIVPGSGETLAVENLFEETADYIRSLQYKVEALRFLVTFVENSQNNKRKLGG